MISPCILLVDNDVKLLVNLEATLNRAGLRSTPIWITESGCAYPETVTEDGSVEYDVVTGMLYGQTPFRTHGHLVRFRIVGTPAPYG